MENRLSVSLWPHLHRRESVAKIMWLVVASLIPAGVWGVFVFGRHAFWVVILGVACALASEGLLQLLTKRKVTFLDGSAFLTGLLLAYNLPPDVPLWLPVVGAFFSIAIGKQVFGGLGQNIFNPALVGRVFLMASWPRYMTNFTPILHAGRFSFPPGIDVLTSATPLTLLKDGKPLVDITYWHLFLGWRGGCIGEGCILALLLGAVFLLWRGYISGHIPLTYLFTTGILTYVFGPKGAFTGDWLLHLLSGGLVLGAFFMATDYVTSPLTRKGQIVFGIGCGVLTAVIRLWGGSPEGVSYAILMMNAATPLIDRYSKNRIYGRRGKIV